MKSGLVKIVLFQMNGFQCALRASALLAVLFLVSGFPISARAQEGQCADLFVDSIRVLTAQEQSLIQEFTQGSKSFISAHKLGTQGAALPPEARNALLQDIGTVYRLVPKQDPSPTASWHIGGRRLLDYVQTLILRHDLFFKELIEDGIPSYRAYEFFLKGQQERVHGKYSAREVFIIVDVLQKKLQNFRSPGYAGPADRLLLAGSFINGKANLLKSDIDMTLGNPKMMRELKDWELEINERLKQSLGGEETKMTLEAHSEPADFYGRINPVVIEVMADRVNLLIFAPARMEQTAHDLRAGPHISYPLEIPGLQNSSF